jgi:hypothetical protein
MLISHNSERRRLLRRNRPIRIVAEATTKIMVGVGGGGITIKWKPLTCRHRVPQQGVPVETSGKLGVT